MTQTTALQKVESQIPKSGQRKYGETLKLRCENSVFQNRVYFRLAERQADTVSTAILHLHFDSNGHTVYHLIFFIKNLISVGSCL